MGKKQPVLLLIATANSAAMMIRFTLGFLLARNYLVGVVIKKQCFHPKHRHIRKQKFNPHRGFFRYSLTGLDRDRIGRLGKTLPAKKALFLRGYPPFRGSAILLNLGGGPAGNASVFRRFCASNRWVSWALWLDLGSLGAWVAAGIPPRD